MDYEMDFELVLRWRGRKVMDARKARVLRAISKGGDGSSIAKELHCAKGRLLELAEGLEDEEGRPLVAVSGERASLTERGERLLELYDSRARFVREQIEGRYRNPLLTVDAIVPFEDGLVVVRRERGPAQGMLALPGGIVEYGETVEEAVAREVREETGLQAVPEELVAVRSRPDRDPRGHFVSVVFLMRAVGGSLAPGDDAAGVEVVPLDPLPDLAFDHSAILEDYLASRADGGARRPRPNR